MPVHPAPSAPLPLWRRREVFRILLIALLAEIAYAMVNILTMPVYLREDRRISEGVIGLVLVAYLFSEAVFKGPMGHLADRYGHKRLIVLGPSISIVTSLASLIIPHDWGVSESLLFMGLRVLDGIGAAMLWPALFALMGDSAPCEERQQSMSLLNSCYLIGIAVALPIGGIVNSIFGSHLASFSGAHSASLFFSAFLFLAVAIAGFRTLPGRQDIQNRHAAALDDAADIRTLGTAVQAIPGYLLIGFVTFCGIGFTLAIIQFFAIDQLKMTQRDFGFLALPGALAMAGLSVPMAKYGEKIGRVRAVRLGLALTAAGLVCISLGAVIPWMRSTFVFAVAGIPIGIGFLITIPAWYASVSEIDPKRRAVNIGAVMTAQGLGAMVGTPIGGWCYRSLQVVSPEFGRYSPFMGCALCVLAAYGLSRKILHEAPVKSLE